MRNRWSVLLLLLTGCLPTQLLPEDPVTQQVASTPFSEPRRGTPTRVSYAPASQETSHRVLLIKNHLVGANPTVALKPYIIAIGAADPEIFHTDMNHIYITEGLVRQCRTDGQLAAVVAYELGRMVAEREAAISDDVRMPERLLPMPPPIAGNGNARATDQTFMMEIARHEKQYPKQARKLTRPNPDLIARDCARTRRLPAHRSRRGVADLARCGTLPRHGRSIQGDGPAS